MKFKFIVIWLLSLLFCNKLFSQTKTDEDYIKERLINDIQSNLRASSLDQSIADLLPILDENGSWKDINYGVTGPAANWYPAQHFSRLLILVNGYTYPQSAYYNNVNLYNKIVTILTYWVDLSPSPYATNWWFRGVGIPLNLGSSLLLLENSSTKISTELKEKLYRWIDNDGKIYNEISANSGDANKSDYSKIMIMIGCVKKSPTLIQQGFNLTGSSIYVGAPHVDGGLLPDNSIMFHGRFLYMEGYGRVYFDNVIRFMNLGRGTKYEYSADKVAIISNLIRNGYFRTLRGKFSDFNIWGRGISRYGNATAVDFAKDLKTLDVSSYADYYETISQKINGLKDPSYRQNSINTHFWYTDYMTHQRPNYMIGLRSVSTRTNKTEIGNQENLKAKFFTEGVTFIATRGDEYDGIYPIWDWNKIPGTTLPESNPYATTDDGRGKTNFVGGISDGKYGASTFLFDDYGTKAKKSWFFFDNEVVCLGSGITSTNIQAINTTLNQSFLKGNITIKKKNESEVVLGDQADVNYVDNLDWVFHDGVGYYFPSGGNIKLSNLVQSGSWKDINTSNPNTTVAEKVFKLYFNHGIAPQKANYVYFLIPGVASTSEITNFNPNSINIITNNEEVQAVEHTSLNIVQAVFYKAGSFVTKNGLTIAANQPCIIMVKNLNQNLLSISASDPSQTLANVILTIQKNDDIPERLDLSFPQGVLKGSTIEKKIDLMSSTNSAAFYKNCNYNEHFASISEGNYSLKQLRDIGISSNNISSLKVKNGYIVTLYSEDNFKDKSIVKTANDECLIDDDFNDKTNSITIKIGAASFYKHTYYGGNGVMLGEGNYTLQHLRSLGIENDNISSLKILNDFQVTLYENDNFTGKKLILNSSQEYLGNFNDIASSITIKKIVGSVYKHYSYQGPEIKLAADNYTLTDLKSMGMDDNDISSFKLNPNYQTVLFDGNEFNGNKVIYNNNTANLFNFNDQTSSIKIQPTVLSIFSDSYFKTNEVTVGEGIYTTQDLLNLGMSDNTISSLKISDGFQVILFDGNNLSGNRFTTSSDQFFLESFNDKTSSLKIGSIAATFFKHSDYGGSSVSLMEGTYNLQELLAAGILNDDISSIKVTDNYNVTIYEDDNFRGASGYFVSNQSNLANLNDRTSSIKIEKINPLNTIENKIIPNLSIQNYLNQTNNIVIFPNPATEYLSIKSMYKMNSIAVSSIDGRCNININGMNTSAYDLDIKNLNPGTYIIIVNGSWGTYTHKFIKN